jgi:hypothetical protein
MARTVAVPRWFLVVNAALWLVTVVCWAGVILT